MTGTSEDWDAWVGARGSGTEGSASTADEDDEWIAKKRLTASSEMMLQV